MHSFAANCEHAATNMVQNVVIAQFLVTCATEQGRAPSCQVDLQLLSLLREQTLLRCSGTLDVRYFYIDLQNNTPHEEVSKHACHPNFEATMLTMIMQGLSGPSMPHPSLIATFCVSQHLVQQVGPATDTVI